MCPETTGQVGAGQSLPRTDLPGINAGGPRPRAPEPVTHYNGGMKPRRTTGRGRGSREGERLIALAQRLDVSGSQLEDRYWEHELEGLVTKLLAAGNDNAVESALDQLYSGEGSAYEVLMDACEAAAESQVVIHEDAEYDVLLIAAPILAWTRHAIPGGPVRANDLEALRVQLGAHVLAADARLALAPYLYSLDQIPQSFAEAYAVTRRLGAAALAGTPPKLEFGDLAETAPLLADGRFLLGAVAVPRGRPVFRWQEIGDVPALSISRARCLENWNAQGRPNITPLLPACGFELLLPDAFYVSLQDSDRKIRPYTIKAAAAWIETAAHIVPADVRAIIAGVGEDRVDEYRIGFAARERNPVLQGVVWPLFGSEAEEGDGGAAPGGTPVDAITAVLREVGITAIEQLPGRHFPEYCEDCGAPLFPDPRGDFVHAEEPEETKGRPTHLH